MTEQELVGLREEILGYCQRLTTDFALAEDITQETILLGLRHLTAKKQVLDWRAWLRGIARTLLKAAMRRAFSRREEALEENLEYLEKETQEFSACLRSDDPLEALVLRERGDLLDQAFSRLDENIRPLLLARYLEDTPVAEIAYERGVSESTLHVQLHRARASLTQTLTTDFAETAAAHGFLTSEQAEGWSETALYCPRCGRNKLVGKSGAQFALRCPRCDSPGEKLLTLSTATPLIAPYPLLANITSYRVGLRRINEWWDTYLTTGIARQSAACVYCGRQAPAYTRLTDGRVGFLTRCPSCRQTFYIHPAGLLLHTKQGQAFWKEHPKMRYSPPQYLTFQGEDAIQVAYEDPHSAARLEAIYLIKNMQKIL